MLDHKIILAGYSGHGFVVADATLAAGGKLKYYTDINESRSNPFDLIYLGDESKQQFNGWQLDCDFIVGVGDNRIRQRIINMIISKGKDVINIIHPTASIGSKFDMKYGNFIARQVAISPLVIVGIGCILNTGCVLEHECELSDYVHIAPGAVLAGNVHVGARSFIGANAVIKQGIKIGSDVIIGAGAVVLKDVENGKKIVGNPGRSI